MGKGETVNVMHLDIRKDFDTIPHEMFISKLGSYDLDQKLGA